MKEALEQIAEGNETTISAGGETTVVAETTIEGETTLPVGGETTLPLETTLEGETTIGGETTVPASGGDTTLPVPFSADSLNAEDGLKVFNKLTGLKLDSAEKIQEFSKIWEKLPDYQKNIDLFPKLVEELKKSKNVLSHFQDETAYKVSQVAKKNTDYKDKESVLNTVMRSDIPKLSDIQILKLAAELNAPDGVRNPLRAKISSMGMDPDEVINKYEDLSDDDKDTLAMAAGTDRRTLSKIGSDIELPETVDNVLSEIEAESQATKDDLEARRVKIAPISESIVGELKEIPIKGDFMFQVDLSDEDKSEFAELLTDTLLSGNIDASTKEGKTELWEMLTDAIWLSKKGDILKAYETDITAKADAAAAIKYNNEQPLKKEEPDPTKKDEGKQDATDLVIEEMVNERQ